MMAASLHVYPGQDRPAGLLAVKLGLETHNINIHTFPDGESLLRVTPVRGTAIIYASLDHPNDKLIHILQAAQALREGGAARVVLVCPYLCYMRQDKAFHEGEAVTQKLLGPLLGPSFDRIITVDPHLHRVSTLAEVFPGREADALSAAALIGEAVTADDTLKDAVLVGPDGESRQWVAAAAQASGLEFIVATKERFGDRDVQVCLPDADQAKGRPAVIIDDLISSGATMQACARLLVDAGASRVEAMAVHAVCGEKDLGHLKEAGIARVRSCDGILHTTNAISLAPLLAKALTREVSA
ncbi:MULTISPECIES: ribose-phosphate diphosphokinase [Kordiimonas]|jgi:ribose-phosphate pyrophosphokinase|uniref:ribose-phosphate diphosphokinase n=1 Tax=Kordiimonas TaxID=288021 RepID=UPI00257C7C39|nr:ribose-phosphate diphosphokinase [Kordiimonas sp. UBA4487]